MEERSQIAVQAQEEARRATTQHDPLDSTQRPETDKGELQHPENDSIRGDKYFAVTANLRTREMYTTLHLDRFFGIKQNINSRFDSIEVPIEPMHEHFFSLCKRIYKIVKQSPFYQEQVFEPHHTIEDVFQHLWCEMMKISQGFDTFYLGDPCKDPQGEGRSRRRRSQRLIDRVIGIPDMIKHKIHVVVSHPDSKVEAIMPEMMVLPMLQSSHPVIWKIVSAVLGKLARKGFNLWCDHPHSSMAIEDLRYQRDEDNGYAECDIEDFDQEIIYWTDGPPVEAQRHCKELANILSIFDIEMLMRRIHWEATDSHREMKSFLEDALKLIDDPRFNLYQYSRVHLYNTNQEEGEPPVNYIFFRWSNASFSDDHVEKTIDECMQAHWQEYGFTPFRWQWKEGQRWNPFDYDKFWHPPVVMRMMMTALNLFTLQLPDKLNGNNTREHQRSDAASIHS